MDNDFHPLSDIWDEYQKSLDFAARTGVLDDPELSDAYAWPQDLRLNQLEQDDIKRYVQERTAEVINRIQKERGLDPNLVAAYIFRSIICALMLAAERRGN
jgi:hypothetical protein